jgi:virulence factor Mce-like protein
MRRILISGALILAAAAFVVLSTGASKGSAAGSYKIELDDGFGLVTGADFKVAGVPAGSITNISLDQKTLHALVTVSVTKPGFGQFHSDATCESRPESLIGEYYIDCNPGSSGPVLKAGSTIPVTHTISTIPGDLLQDVMRLPYRERFTLIVNELGAAAAARGGDLQAALYRADPALRETDALLNLLANDSATLQALTRDSDSVVTALANNSANVNRFIVQAGHTATYTATQQANLRTTLARLPALLAQLRPTLAQLGTTVTTNTPVLRNLNTASAQLDRFFTDLPGFSRSSKPAIRALGQASVTGRQAVIAAAPTVSDLNRFAQSTPELAQNLAIVLQDLDTQNRAVEPDPRSPGGRGFSGLQALLGYVFNQTLAINTFGPEGHVLAVDAFFSPECSNYATPATVAMALKQDGPSYRNCYSWLGPNQPGVNEPDPSNPGAAVPDPGGAPPGERGPTTSARKLLVSTAVARRPATTGHTGTGSGSGAGSGTGTGSSARTASGSASSSSASSTAQTSTGPAINLHSTVSQLFGSSPASSGTPSAGSASSSAAGSSSGSMSSGQAQQLLSYLLAP